MTSPDVAAINGKKFQNWDYQAAQLIEKMENFGSCYFAADAAPGRNGKIWKGSLEEIGSDGKKSMGKIGSDGKNWS